MTAATAHTPGPWRAPLIEHPHSDWKQVAIVQGFYTDAPIVAFAEGHDVGFAAMIANAHLIAAAPSLLAVLQELLIETNQHAEGECPKLLLACNNARAAIAAAKGE